ncbi:bifunctional 4-hydroxy-2-oxoglutarate aldolase/2-dehydro-3-deoxy-phosphogluconate aldolase [Paenarthrobacter sp. OM7]|uniref:bifunctional 4-hydroxy-2-oxoglutarate aldolase/2-dehydro-3-deoxy-phosphogluconate aldolase n=1 Tax=Paenarthrobacter sp. OM7 TaxID=3041264 RepID=UPI00246918D3|nr:bifunctional 4-hydroxy-2-oxoglutarate aldolase/2-dehydro-3-deoxy-phosphogluconate aldolase [Paenarthrobacter sp. OM7]WGM20506.1 bifunctional 4-hydroxy-2-oxoglutarate aldolase/2-dehydro-3-deoxy-phosphogluconate aldolase [Paenarthrobacter sp. OM7]
MSTIQPAGKLHRPASSAILKANPVVAVMRAHHAREYAPVIEALVRGGVRSIELTLSTQGVFEELPRLKERFGPDAEIGVGTITTVDQALQALDCGADYLVTPAMVTAVVSAAVERDIPVFPGGLTPTELLAGWNAGATAVKLFPASAVGIGYVDQLRGPFPEMRIVPSGGIGIDDAPAWIAAGALAVSLGGPLLRDAFSGGSLTELTARAEKLSRLISDAAETKASK